MSDAAMHDYLTFSLADETFALPIEHVLEVVELGRLTALPRADDALRGLTDLRGEAVPVLDLRCLLGYGDVGCGHETNIIVMELPDGEGGSSKVGAMADAVHEVVGMSDAELEAPPQLGHLAALAQLKGIFRRNGTYVLVLDTEGVIAPVSLAAM